MLKKLTIVAVAASVVLGSVGVGTAANAAPAKPAVAKVSVAKVAGNPFTALRGYAQDVARLKPVNNAIDRAKGAQKTKLIAQRAAALKASQRWYQQARVGGNVSQLHSLRAKANTEIGKAISLALQVR